MQRALRERQTFERQNVTFDISGATSFTAGVREGKEWLQVARSDEKLTAALKGVTWKFTCRKSRTVSVVAVMH
jgi:lipocalin